VVDTNAAPVSHHPGRPGKVNSVPPLSDAQDSAGLCFCLPCRSRRSALERAANQSGDVEFRVHFSLVTDSRATYSPLTSGKHLSGITNVPCADPTPQIQFRLIWARVPVDVGSDYAMWAPITADRRMLPVSERNCRPHQTDSGAHIDRNTQLPTVGLSILILHISKTEKSAAPQMKTAGWFEN
jgi:hypothetical protein